MGSTNATVNYSLSQFIGTDKPSWLNDYDNDMFKIDAQMKLNATAAANAKTTADTADGKADANALAISTLDSQINTAGTGLAANVSANTTAIGTIDGTIGNTPLTTVAQTLTGAIEEVKSSIPTESNLLKFTGSHTVEATASTDTYASLLGKLRTALTTYLAGKETNYRAKIVAFTPNNNVTANGRIPSMPGAFIDSNFTASIDSTMIVSTTMYHTNLAATGVVHTFDYSTGTYADISNNNLTDGYKAVLVLEEYEIISI